jgi:hypothetical protein
VSALVEQTLTELTSTRVVLVRDGLSRTAGFFEHAAGNPNPVEPEVVTDPASPAELDELRDAVIELVLAAPNQHVAASLFALGKHRDPSVVQFFIQWLVEHWREDPRATHQALIGLDNLGEPALGIPGGLSSADPDLTLRQAEHYLRSLNLI